MSQELRKGPSVGDPILDFDGRSMRVERRIAEIVPGKVWAVVADDDTHAIVEWDDNRGYTITRQWCVCR
jgi:hypothetical protein